MEETNFTFSSKDSNEKFTVSREVAKLSTLFKTMLEGNSHDDTVVLEPVKQEDFIINTTDLLRWVYKYFKLWEETPDLADYVVVKPYQTNDITHILRDKDIEFIQSYLIGLESRKQIIAALGILLTQVDEFVEINSLSNKIYAYISVLIWNTSAVDFAEAMEDPDFKEAQDKALEEWKLANPDHFSNYVRSHTTDGVNPSLAPAINGPLLELDESDFKSNNDNSGSESEEIE